MKKALIAALASLMLAGALAGASDFSLTTVSSTSVSLSEGTCPAPMGMPTSLSYGASASH